MAKLRNHFYWKYLQHITLIFSRTSVDVHSGCPWFFAWNSSNYRENKFDIRSTKLPPIKIFSQLTQAFLEILKSRIWSIRAATIIEHIWLCSLLFYHWVQWFNLQFLQCKMKYILKRSLYQVFGIILLILHSLIFFVGYSFLMYSNVNIFLNQEQVINF